MIFFPLEHVFSDLNNTWGHEELLLTSAIKARGSWLASIFASWSIISAASSRYTSSLWCVSIIVKLWFSGSRVLAACWKKVSVLDGAGVRSLYYSRSLLLLVACHEEDWIITSVGTVTRYLITHYSPNTDTGQNINKETCLCGLSRRW